MSTKLVKPFEMAAREVDDLIRLVPSWVDDDAEALALLPTLEKLVIVITQLRDVVKQN